MTRITPVCPSQQPLQGREVQKTDGAGFQETLQKTMAVPQSPLPASAGAGALGEIRPAVMPAIETGSASVADRTGRLINLLHQYARELEDPVKSLKEIAPLVGEIQSQADQLMAEADRALPQDPDLLALATRSAVTANVEVVRFQRGDYI